MNEQSKDTISETPVIVKEEFIKEEFTKEDHDIPEYLKTVYNKRYFHPSLSQIFDDEWTAALATFFQGKMLTRIVTNEIIEGDDVLQLGIASGTFERDIATKMNSNGKYHIEDISPVHAESVIPRIAPWLNAAVRERDFTIPNELRYDVVIGYFLLHELPDARKKAVLKRAFHALKPTGKMIFVDYARPDPFHPLKYPLKIFNRLYEPFAESLWYNEIADFAPKTDKLIWAKKTFFGDMYQCVIAQKH